MCLWPSFKLLMFGLTKLFSVPRSPCPPFLGHLTNMPVFVLAWRDVLCSGPEFHRQSRDSSILDFLQLILGHISGSSTIWWKHEQQYLNLLFNWIKWDYVLLSAFRFAFNSPHNLTTRALLLILQLPNSWFNADIIWKWSQERLRKLWATGTPERHLLQSTTRLLSRNVSRRQKVPGLPFYHSFYVDVLHLMYENIVTNTVTME